MRLAGRIIIWALGVYFCVTDQSVFSVLEKGAFALEFSPLHLLWGVWMADMLGQLIPAKRNLALGSKKLFRQYFVPGRSCELRDVLIDTAGIVSGIIVICLFKTVKRKLKKV